ncbi:hypothetical protein LTR36_001042 [Oleoguttula mirabilis]|uniref:Uncharacterized protein n=1 Tax=Oleoguttula mirabilis TaxID=1507867 RepID=A0AAV9JQY6_9PEZI|nr:hypothetical protein LTR36_001042 [Oleoguttula mirabilis]
MRMWDWDTVMEAFAGSGPARHLRAHEFHEDVRRAGIAQEERRALSAFSSLRNSGVASRRSFSPVRSSPAPNYGTPSSPYAPKGTVALFAIQAGSVRPRRVDTALRNSVHYEVLIPTAKTQDAKEESDMTVRVDSATASRVSTPQHSRTASPSSTHNTVGSSYLSSGSSRSSSQSDLIKSTIDDELRAHESGPHLSERGSRERRRPEVLDAITDYTRAPLPEFIPCHVRLARMARTVPSTTITSDGCVIQKGFVIIPCPSARPPRTARAPPVSGFAGDIQQDAPVLRACTPVRAVNTPVAKPEPKPRESKPTRRITWDERTIARVDDDDLAGAAGHECKQAHSSSAGPRYSTADGPNETETRSASDGTWSTDSTVLSTPTPRAEPRVRIVPAEEAEIAIEDEDSRRSDTAEEEAFVPPRTPLRPSKRLTPPAKGILKQPSGRTMSTESSGESAQLNQMAGTGPNVNATRPAQRTIRFARQRQTAPPPRPVQLVAAMQGGGRTQPLHI